MYFWVYMPFKINKTETKDYKTILTAKYVYQKNKSI